MKMTPTADGGFDITVHFGKTYMKELGKAVENAVWEQLSDRYTYEHLVKCTVEKKQPIIEEHMNKNIEKVVKGKMNKILAASAEKILANMVANEIQGRATRR